MNHGGFQAVDPLLQGLLANRALPPSLLRVVITRGGRGVWTTALRRNTLDSLSQRLLRDRLGAETVDPVSAASGMLPGWRVAVLARSPRPEVRAAVARRPEIDSDVLRMLCEDTDDEVRRAGAGNTALSFGMLDRALVVGDTAVLLGMSVNGALPETVAERLAESSSVEIRARLARNAALPAVLARRLAGDTSREVRLALLANASAPSDVIDRVYEEGLPAADIAATAVHPQVLDHLADARWSDAAVLLPMARNPACDTGTLDRMAFHNDLEVRRAALSTLRVGAATLQAYAASSDPWVRSQVARSPHCPPHLLERFRDDSAGHVRAAMARNHHCPPSLLAALCRDDNRNVRYRCARNPGTAVQYVVALVHDSDPLVAAAAATNPALPVREMHLIVSAWKSRTESASRSIDSASPNTKT
ncbi:hypothetical protein ACIODT_29165 [Streptomyces sp. NPDC088251]|uniref:hypothetical protein n=1 Tax=unclassified Streptomyces TaxID=2593676 RepID=UPI0038139241